MTTTTDHDLILSAGVELTAGTAGKAARISIVAYTGGIMTVAGFGPVLIELSGLELPEQVPLLCDHANLIRAAVGFGTPTVKNRRLVIHGELVRGGAAAEEVIRLARGGLKLAASVGVELRTSERPQPGEVFKVNGRRITVPAGGVL